jgi:copper(I)-binding protein
LPVVSNIKKVEHKVVANVKGGKKVTAKLNYTSDHGPVNAREWQSVNATVSDGTIVAELPSKEVTAWFLTVTDKRNATISSEVFLE